MKKSESTYKISFFFDYYCGGCLWTNNNASLLKFGSGPIDRLQIDFNGRISSSTPIIDLPNRLRSRIQTLDNLYCDSIDLCNYKQRFVWKKEQWKQFDIKTKLLFNEISEYLGDDFEVVYKQYRMEN